MGVSATESYGKGRSFLKWTLFACTVVVAVGVAYSAAPPSEAEAQTSNAGGSSAGGSNGPPTNTPPPIARNDRFIAREDKALRIPARGVLRNDRGVGLRAFKGTNPRNGRLTLRQNGSLVYVPRANFNGRDFFVYRARDNRGRVNRATVIVIVRPVNDAPVARGNSYKVDEYGTLNVAAPGVLGNDSDVDRDRLSAAKVSSPDHGNLTLRPNGSFTYEPDRNHTGTDSFTYRASDGKGASDTATVDISVNAVNDAPVVDLNGSEDGTSSTAEFLEAAGPDGGDPATLAPDVEVTDVDDENIESATVKLTNRPDGNGAESLDANVGVNGITGVTKNYEPSTGTLTISGTATKDEYRRILATVAYDNTASPPGGANRVLDNDQKNSGTMVASAGWQGNANKTEKGGNITVRANGTFEYGPPVGYGGADRFTYTLNGGSQATVMLSVEGMIWFVDENATTNGDGRLSSPFSSLSAFNGVNGNGGNNDPAANDNIFLYESSAEYTGGASLLSGQRLIGQDANQTLSTITGLTPPSGSAALPETDGATPDTTKATIVNSGGNGIILDDGNTIRGLTVGNTSASGIRNSTATGDATMGADVAVSGTNGAAVHISGGSGTVNYNGTISNTAGGAVTVIERSGGSVNFNGNVNSTANGILVENNTGGAVNFSGATKKLNTGSNNAVSLSNNGGATVNFTNGGLDIDTTTGIGFDARNGATAIEVSGAGDTINSGTGTALNVANTNIGAGASGEGGLNFQRISATGATNGIVLNGTGTSGGLTVTGNGGTCAQGTPTCSGGTIQNTTGDGISLTNTRDVSLDSMLVKDAGRHGIFGTGVTNMTLDNIRNDGAGDAASEHGMDFGSLGAGNVSRNNLLGAVNITNSAITNMHQHGVIIENVSGALTMNVTDTTFSNSHPTEGGDGIFAQADGSSNITLNVGETTANGCQFSNLNTDAVKMNPEGTGTSVGNLNVSGCTINAVGGGDGAINIGAINNTRGIFDIRNNTITNTEILGISVAALDDSELTGQIANNIITGSGAEGILLLADGGPSLSSPVIKSLIENNHVSGQTDKSGVRISSRGGNGGIVHTRFKDNMIATPTNGGLGGSDGVRMRAEDGMSLCLDIRNSDSSGNISSGTGEPSSGLAGYLVSDISTGTFQLEGFTTGGNVHSFFNSQGNSGSVRVDAAAPVSGTCDTP